MLTKVNKKLLPMKAHYFLWNAGTAPVVPFLSTYARQLGFSSVVVGLIYTILPICGMLAKPLVGAFADRFRCQKATFLAAQLLTAVAFMAINFSPEIPLERKVHFSCDDGQAVFDTSPNNMTVDDCLVTQLQKEGGSVICNLNCAMESSDWEMVSDHWNLSEYKVGHPDSFKFTATVPKSKIEKLNDIVFFKIHNITLEDGTTHSPLCPCSGTGCHISSLCSIKCDDYNLNELIAKPSISDNDVYGRYQFWVFLLLMIVGWVGQAISVSVGDAICFEMLGDQPAKYGYQRLFGALGWGIFSIIAGVMVDALSDGSTKKNFESAFYLAVVFLIVDFVSSCRIQYIQKKLSTSILRDVGRLLVDIRILVFLLWCVCVGICTGLIWQFLFWLIEDLAKEQGCDSQGWIKTLEGIVMAVQTLCGEMPFFFLSGTILKRIGHTNSMTLVVLVIGIRYILYSVIPNPWWFLPLELTNGLTFGLFYACMASYASIIAPPGTEATMQGMVGAIFEGVGVSLGSFLGGLLYSEYGGPWTFRLFGIGSLIFCLFHAGIQYLLRKSGNTLADYEASFTVPKDSLDMLDDDYQQELRLVGD